LLTCAPMIAQAASLHAEIVRAPAHDRLFDIGVGKVLRKRLLRQAGNVRGETQCNQLRLGQVADFGAQWIAAQALQTQALFQANQAVLHSQAVDARFKARYDDGHRQREQDPTR